MTATEAGDADEAPVSTLELFFDLVFVFTVTQITEVVDHHPGVEGAVQGLLVLGVMFWMYGGFAWLSNTMGTQGLRQRLIILTGMAAMFVCSQAVPDAFTDSGVAMGVAFLALTLIHLGGFLWLGGPTAVRAMRRLAPLNIGAALLVLAAGWTQGVWDWVLWGSACAVFVFATVRSRGFQVRPRHFAERHGLMIIIVLGESVISVALAAQRQHLDLRLVTGCLLGVLAIITMWWAYFVGDDEIAAGNFAAADADGQSRLARLGYDQTHLFMIAGIIGVAAGTRLGLADLLAPAAPAAAWLIGGGSALFLLSTARFRAVLRVGPVLSRLVGSVLLLATAGVGTAAGTAQQLGGVAVVVGLAIAAGRAGARRPATAAQS